MNTLAQVNIGDQFNSPFGQDKNISDFVSIILSNAVAIAGVILLVILILGGIAMVAGAGKNDPDTAAKGKQAATSAAIGFVVIFAAYWIIQLIETLTGLNILGTN